MKRSMKGCALVGLLVGLVGCEIDSYDDCDSDDEWCECDDGGFGQGASSSGGTNNAGAPAEGGTTSTGGTTTTGGTTSTGGTTTTGGTTSTAGSGGSAGAPVEPPTACEDERDCEPGFNCDAETQQCLPSEQETCGELTTEVACANRRDCAPIYGGIDCSCGADCECEGGEAGCVCQSFDFVLCRAAE